MMDLDQAIDQSYWEASDAEASARRLKARIEQIPGARGLLPAEKLKSWEFQKKSRKSDFRHDDSSA